jgi:hypothetical protein
MSITAKCPTILRMLDLSTAHLPKNVCDELNSIDGITAARLEYGWLLAVPTYVDEHVADYGQGPDGIPDVVVGVWRYARQHNCDYVLFDADADKVDDLPHWEW